MNFLRTKHLVAIAGIACLLVMGNQAFATEDAIDVVPAATLLLPYFEVDLDSPAGITTLFSVNNASAAPQLAHITLWTDMSRPTLDFTIYLTGYDVQTFNLGSLFRDGSLPLLEGPKPDPPGLPNVDDNAGAFSIAGHGGDAITAGESELHVPAAPAAAWKLPRLHPSRSYRRTDSRRLLERGPVRRDHRRWVGKHRSAGTQDNIARGYVTVDVVTNCSQWCRPTSRTTPVERSRRRPTRTSSGATSSW